MVAATPSSHSAATGTPMTPLGWGDTLAGRPTLDRRIGGAVPALIRRWRGIPADIDQLALDQHYLSIHLGGSKRLHRNGEGHRLIRDAECGAYSVVPAGSAYRWQTEGPIDFMHIYLAPRTIDRFVARNFGQDHHRTELHDCLGANDPLISSLATALTDELANEDGIQQVYVDDLMQLLLIRLLRLHSDVSPAASRNLYALPPYKLRRALDFIEAQLDRPIGVAEIAAAVGTSAFHFSRAFRHSMGRPPYAYLLERRVAKAKLLLDSRTMALAEIARQCGFGGLSQFSRIFKKETGVSPSGFRNDR